ncbi:FAD/NAD-P-binding domain-containing protein [Lentinus tigrinus ALCF2SS1-6]|uniref:FAD/NAD-P-binding domain-containing protein n=1 Tax=Lentinus tigrinus ALCF2SS1-6 TaxID=1328759 RepID=A0A5C2SD60_9APHY|nr:FAD/NAD-P-binding domain-containing protein [Lentinus tigrinus ALCF2SS1-6]
MAIPKFRVAICGGGIAGLTLAIALKRYAPPDSPLHVDIYEGDTEVRTAGAGITIWTRTWGVMRHLGVHEDLARVAVRAAGEAPGSQSDEYRPAFIVRKANQPEEGYTFISVDAPAGSETAHRRDMMDVFLRHIPPAYTLHTSKRLVRYTEVATDSTTGGSLTLHFADGTTAEADVLFGADGIHSTTRTCMYEDAHTRQCVPYSHAENVPSREECPRCAVATPKWTGMCSYRCLIPTEKLYKINPDHTTAGIGAVLCYIATYQVSGGKFLNFVAICRVPGGEGTPYPSKWVVDVSREEVVSKFVGWEPEVQQMLECVENPSRWAIHTVENLPFVVSCSGRVALLGDAMHAMSPNLGGGGGQAIEDAYILGRLLASPHITLADVPTVLQIYERVRLPFVNVVSQCSRDVGLMYEFNAPGYYDGSPITKQDERAQLNVLGDAICKEWECQWTESIDSLWAEAEEMLQPLVTQTY